jgi:general secretion pathway protein L
MASSAKHSSPPLAAAWHALRVFLRWWGSQLVELIPLKLRAWWSGHDRVILLSFDGDKAIFERQEGAQRIEIFSVAPDSADSRMPSDLPRKLALAIGGNFRLLFRAPPDKVLSRELTLPLAVEENLRQTLAFELDRFTPFGSDHAYFVFRVIERVPDQARLVVELSTLAKSVLDSALSRAEAMGISVHGAVLAGEILEHGSQGNGLLPSPTNRAHMSRSLRRWRLVAGLAALCLFCLALIVPIWQKRAAIMALNEPLAKAKATGMEADAVRTRLDALVDRHNRLPQKKWEGYSTVLVLDELSRRLPDDTFVIQLDFDGKSVQVQGETGSSGTLIEILEASPMFKDVGFKSQLYKVQGTGIDRYHIEATLESGAIPKPISPAAQNPADSTNSAPANATVAPQDPGSSANRLVPAPATAPSAPGVKP